MKILNWYIDPALKEEINDHYRTKYALSLKEGSIQDIYKKITFDSVASDITPEHVRQFVDYINNTFLNKKINGVGLEVGGGCGFFSAILANIKDVEKVYSVEVCENIVKELMPKVVNNIATTNENADKVIGCVGDFDRLELPNNSIDFVFDFYSLHHSSDIGKTFKEINRVLKPGGFIFCFDKARANYLSDNDLEKLLDKEYDIEAKKAMGIPENKYHTRRMNGEKEYRLRDWKNGFLNSGFSKFIHYNIARLPNTGGIGVIVKKTLAIFPPSIQKLFTGILSRNGNRNNIEQSNKIYTKYVNNFPKEISLMIAWK